MDTVTYASVAVLPCNALQSIVRPSVPEAEFVPLNLAYLTRAWLRLFQLTGSCNDL